jgi:hypothetical protein
MNKLLVVVSLFESTQYGYSQDSLRYDRIDSITSDIVQNKSIVILNLRCDGITVNADMNSSCYNLYFDTVHNEIRQIITNIKDKMTVYVFENRRLIESQLITATEPNTTYTYYFFNDNLIGKSRYTRENALIEKMTFQKKEASKFVQSSRKLLKKFISNHASSNIRAERADLKR